MPYQMNCRDPGWTAAGRGLGVGYPSNPRLTPRTEIVS
jgi:hypothetical protein